jgi:hypothetical protein
MIDMQTPTLLLLLLLLLAVLICLAALLLYPRRTVVEGTELRVRALVTTYTFDLREAKSVRAVDRGEIRNLRTVRLFGVGWPFRPFGWFRNRELGTYISLVTRLEDMYLLEFPKRRLLISPENVRALFLAVPAWVAKS